MKKAVQRIKQAKSSGEEGLNSDHIINGPHILFVLLTNAINCMLIHGVCPDSLTGGLWCQYLNARECLYLVLRTREQLP